MFLSILKLFLYYKILFLNTKNIIGFFSEIFFLGIAIVPKYMYVQVINYSSYKFKYYS